MISDAASQINLYDVTNVVVAQGIARPEAERTANRLIAPSQTGSAEPRSMGNIVGQKGETAANAMSSAFWMALLGLDLSLAPAVLGAARPVAVQQIDM